MTSQDRKNLKLGAKRQVLDHFKFYLLLSILWLALYWVGAEINDRHIGWVTEAMTGNLHLTEYAGPFSFAGLLMLVGAVLHAGTMLTMIDVDRGTVQLDQPVQRSLRVFENGRYFLGWLFIAIWSTVFIFLWTCLLVVPGIIKTLSYSQAFYLYRDAYDQGHPITALEAITRSRQVMDGNKAFLFIMNLSFILWFFLGGLFWGLPSLFVMPYYDLSMAKFYNQLVGVAQREPEAD
ncbi:DUF975 family protein [Levilactobacillus acidifarinae]|uniref:Integral membrane protein n=1 Tax=Levilactobacillus acidifarinae DSM 19394 = JCM 15949 TaxID=1423715 RepID=A0A0R1LLF4_9LACO|nr:DUF975 family protein [Levilactobacillus acidifarinae]KRK96701.1 integral membrane protein [Levilactobacillus acidifarinae DSM 19394]GEO70398.1 membrane protein [Levilactobacillus acidifarinae]